MEKQNGPVKTNASNLSMLKENLFIIILACPKNKDCIFSMEADASSASRQ